MEFLESALVFVLYAVALVYGIYTVIKIHSITRRLDRAWREDIAKGRFWPGPMA